MGIFPLQVSIQSVVSKSHTKGALQNLVVKKGSPSVLDKNEYTVTSVVKSNIPPPLLPVNNNSATVPSKESKEQGHQSEGCISGQSPVCDPLSATLNGRSPRESMQCNLKLSGKPAHVTSEVVKIVPPRILNTRFVPDTSSPSGYKVSMPSSTQSSSVQVIDLTQQCSLDTSPPANGITISTPTKPLPVVGTSQLQKKTTPSTSEAVIDSNSHRNNSTSSTPTKGWRLMLLVSTISCFTFTCSWYTFG